jgi:hypothetical protein
MLASDIPTTKFPIPWGNNASGTYKLVPIPTASQIGVTSGAASLTDGFPPLNFQSVASGGVPPRGKDMNGILYELSGWSRWAQAGGPIQYDGTFAAAIGGYPAGAVLMSNPIGILWVSTADNNTTDPDGGSPADWEPLMPVKAPDPLDETDDTNFVTPMGLAAALLELPPGCDLNQNGYYTLPGGLIHQWGRFTISSGINLTVGFPIAFPTACFSCVVGGGNSTANQDNQVSLISGSITLSQFQTRYLPSGSVQGTFIAYGN